MDIDAPDDLVQDQQKEILSRKRRPAEQAFQETVIPGPQDDSAAENGNADGPVAKKICITRSNLTDVPEFVQASGPDTAVLDLRLNYMRHLSNSVMSSFQMLRVLNLDANELHEVPAAVTRISTLEELHMNSNRITDITNLQHSHRLRILGLRSNRIACITGLASLTNLEQLSLSNNPIAIVDWQNGLPQGGFPALKFLGILGTRLDPEEIYELLAKTPGLEEVWLCPTLHSPAAAVLHNSGTQQNSGIGTGANASNPPPLAIAAGHLQNRLLNDNEDDAVMSDGDNTGAQKQGEATSESTATSGTPYSSHGLEPRFDRILRLVPRLEWMDGIHLGSNFKVCPEHNDMQTS
eukprot:Clim_evm60s22 gene=Clim_evmTU60s22